MRDEALYVGPSHQPDKYRLKRQVGTGGESRLWEAELDLAGVPEPVALKVLRVEREADIESWQARWAEQAEVLRFIRHPGVVGVREHFRGGGMHYRSEEPSASTGLYLVMNWVAGTTLRDWSRAHRMPSDMDLALNYLAQVGDVLDWLHSGQATPSGRPVIHADVTVSNVIVTPSGQAVLVDFGLARVASGLGSSIEGTGGYLAPEVRAAGAYSPASDRYAFGALAFSLITGETAPSDLLELRSRLEVALARVGRPEILEPLMQMFVADPMARPNCGDWIRSFRLGGSTSFDEGAAMAPPAPGSTSFHQRSILDREHAAMVVDPPAGSQHRSSRRKVLATTLASVVALVAAGLAASSIFGDTSASGVSGGITSTAGVDATAADIVQVSFVTDSESSTTIVSTTTPSTTSSTTSSTTTTIPSAAPPVIDAVSSIRTANDGFAISGSGFGEYRPVAGADLPCIMFFNNDGGWYAGYIQPRNQDAFTLAPCDAPTITQGSTVTMRIVSWTDSEIRIEQLDGAYGTRVFSLRVGDRITIKVANAQTGAATDFNATVLS